MRTISTCFFSSLAVLCLSFEPAIADDREQIAKLLPGDGAANDQFGSSVAISGTTAIVGVFGDDDNGDFSGSAYLFNTLTGMQIAKLLPGDGAADDQFGFSVAISGTTAIVGSAGDDDNGIQSGSAYLFDTLTGLQIAKLLPDDGGAFNLFGNAVAISGTTAIVGSFGDDDNGSFSGSAYLFDTLTGMQVAKLLPADGTTDDIFGSAVAISGTTAMVGAFRSDDNGSQSGSAYLFDTLTGIQIAKLLPNVGAAFDNFGISVAISGTTALVGASGDDDNGAGSGSAYIFDTFTGMQIAKLLPEDGAAGDDFGRSVAINGTTAIVGARVDEDNGTGSGSAYLFDTIAGVQIAKFLPGDGAAGDLFGISVAISGTTAIASAIFDDDNGISSGSAYLFDSAPIQASTSTRNGSGLNAAILSRVTDPELGSNFITDLDCSGHSPSFAVLRANAGAFSGLFLLGGEVLVDLASTFLLSVNQAHTGGVVQFSLAVPNDPSLCGLSASLQGIVFGAPGYELSNALDIVIGL